MGWALTSLAVPSSRGSAASTPGTALPKEQPPGCSCRWPPAESAARPVPASGRRQQERTAGVTQRFALAVPSGRGRDTWRGAACRAVTASPVLSPAPRRQSEPARAPGCPSAPSAPSTGDGHAAGALMWTFHLHGLPQKGCSCRSSGSWAGSPAPVNVFWP